MTALRLTKHHGAGNDFLVLLDAEGDRPLTASEARALCDRRLGIGADGVLRATRGGSEADLVMQLRNADGGEAEMSGNGIRCLVQAAVDAGWVAAGEVSVETTAGRRVVHYRHEPLAGLGHATVLMGVPVLGEELSVGAVPGLRRTRAADMGNPHVVLLLDGPPSDDVVAEFGARLEASVPGRANVEFVWEGPGDDLRMRVWERGVGETLACGTGTCAVAAVAQAWGLRGDEVVVHNPGGPLQVTLRGGEAVLGGPTMTVGAVTVDEEALATLVVAHGEVAATR